jgi:hypothetical protein
MVAPRRRPSHRIRQHVARMQASGPTRPALGPLTEFWKTYNPEEDIIPRNEVQLRYRSAPWDDFLDDEETVQQDTSGDDHVQSSRSSSFTSSIDTQDSPASNLLQGRRPPTHYRPVHVPTVPPAAVADFSPFVKTLLQGGASLPPPQGGPTVFQTTQASPLLDEVFCN